MTMFLPAEEKCSSRALLTSQHLWVLVCSHQISCTNGHSLMCAIDTLGSGKDLLAFTVSVIENSDQILNIGFSYQGHPNH